jgi:hypothetical protein
MINSRSAMLEGKTGCFVFIYVFILPELVVELRAREALTTYAMPPHPQAFLLWLFLS